LRPRGLRLAAGSTRGMWKIVGVRCPGACAPLARLYSIDTGAS